MTKDQKYEIACLASEVVRLRRAFENHGMAGVPTDPVKAEESFAAYKIAETEWMEAESRLLRAQGRILQGQ